MRALELRAWDSGWGSVVLGFRDLSFRVPVPTHVVSGQAIIYA